MKFYLYHHHSNSFLDLEDGFIIGRQTGDLRYPDDDLLSAAHCQFQVSGNDAYIIDLHSTNRTRVNSAVIRVNSKRRLQLNDVIEIGEQTLILTHQNTFAPGNRVDAPLRNRIYKAAINSEGTLSTFVSGFLAVQTALGVDGRVYRRMRIRKALKPLQTFAQPLFPNRKIPQTPRSNTRLIAFAFSALVLAAVGWFITFSTQSSAPIHNAIRSIASYF